MDLMQDYKKEPGGKEKLKERNPKWINDDYVKFLRYGQHFIEKNGSGILAFINPHGFLDNPTFRGMRWHLLKTYDKIYTIDLHGNSKKKETAPDGSPDINVFDIMQGVSINVFVKTGKKKANELGKVFHYDLYGKRDFKYDFLNENSLKYIDFKELPNVAPMYFMVQKDFEAKASYDKGFSVNDLFLVNGVGLTTAHDEFVIRERKAELLEFYNKFQSSQRDAEFLHKEFNVRKKTGLDILQGHDNIKNEPNLSKYIEPISYRPFDNRFVFYEDKLVWRTVRKVMLHFLKGENLGLVVKRQCKQIFSYVFLTNKIAEGCLFESAYANNSVLPLYLYPENNNQQTIGDITQRKPNLNEEIVNQIAEQLGIRFVPEKKAPLLCKEGCPEDGVVKNTNQNLAVKNINNLPHLKTFRKELRNNLTPAEAKLWTLLKGKQLEGRKFRRQFSVANYILDFYCPSENLAIELDGQGHFEALQAQYDTERDLFLEHCGIKVLRFENKWVWDNPEGLLEEVKNNFDWRSTPQSCGQLPSKGEQLNCFAPIDILDYIYAVCCMRQATEKNTKSF